MSPKKKLSLFFFSICSLGFCASLFSRGFFSFASNDTNLTTSSPISLLFQLTNNHPFSFLFFCPLFKLIEWHWVLGLVLSFGCISILRYDCLFVSFALLVIPLSDLPPHFATDLTLRSSKKFFCFSFSLLC